MLLAAAFLVVFTLGIFVGIAANKEIDKHHIEVILAEQRKTLEASWLREQSEAMKILDELTRPTSVPVRQQQDPTVTIKERLQKAVDIITKQAQIDTRKGDAETMLHNELELEKLNILRSILKEGHDPVITVRYRTGDQAMTLSQYVDSIQKTLH